MPRADRLKAGDPYISARNMNRAIDNANLVDEAQGGSGIGIAKDGTGFQVQNMRRQLRPDGDSPHSSSAPWRRTTKKNTTETRHKNELELFNSSVVSRWSSSVPTSTSNVYPNTSTVVFYGIPFLPVNNVGSGNLAWGVMDGDSPYQTSIGASGSWRKTLKRRADETTHKNEFELYNSSTVSASGRTSTSNLPQYYGIPFLPVDSSGHGELTWGPMDADEFGTAGPRSLERRSSSSGERFQIYDFNDPATDLESSNVWNVCIRRDFGSSTNDHYVQWVSSSSFLTAVGGAPLSPVTPLPPGSSGSAGTGSSAARWDHVHRAPRWNEILEASSSVDMVPNDDGTKNLRIGREAVGDHYRWKTISLFSSSNIELYSGENTVGGPRTRIKLVEFGSAGSKISIEAYDGAHIELTTESDEIFLDSGEDIRLSASGYVVVENLPTTSPGGGNRLYTQTATQLGGSGTTKVVCIT